MKRSALGLFLILLGTAFLLRNLGYLPDFAHHLFRWPNFMFIIASGMLISGKKQPALIIAIIGAVFFVQRYFYYDWGDLWPIFIIVGGLAYFFRHSKKSTSANSSMNEITIFSGSNRNFSNQLFQGGKITVLFGGTEIDLRDAKMDHSTSLDVFCMFGGIEITAPNNWEIDVQASPIFGGIADERRTPTPSEEKLTIKGLVMFGGVEIKS